jgi:integrase
VETSCRRGEILSLECKDVDLFKRTVSVFGTKTGERRTMLLTERAFAALLEKEKARRKVRSTVENFVFSHPPGRKMNIYTLCSGFKDAIEKAGGRDFNFHDLRHTFASRLAQSGVDPYTIQKPMGHSSFTMTERYAHHSVESLRRGIEYNYASRIEMEKI